jgi:hypothetical protein
MSLRKELEPKKFSKQYRKRIRDKIIEIEHLLDDQGTADEQIKDFNSITGYNYDADYFYSYHGFESLDDFVNKVCVSRPIKDPKMTKEELIEIVVRILDFDNYGDFQEYYMELFDLNVPMPNASNLVFYPENYNPRRDKLGEYNPTPKEIVERALSYKAIEL